MERTSAWDVIGIHFLKQRRVESGPLSIERWRGEKIHSCAAPGDFGCLVCLFLLPATREGKKELKHRRRELFLLHF